MTVKNVAGSSKKVLRSSVIVWGNHQRFSQIGCGNSVTLAVQHFVGCFPKMAPESSRNSIVMLVELELTGRQIGSAMADVGVG